MDRFGVLGATRESRVGGYLMRADPFPGKHLALGSLERRGVRVVGRLFRADGKTVTFAGDETATIEAVVWATGYKDDTKWVAVPEVKAADGAFVHRHGVSSVPVLYSIGRSWQWTRGSALLHGVGDDAAYLVGRIAAHLDRRSAVQTRAPGLASA